MTYKEFRAWAEKRTRDGCWDFRMALLCVYTIEVLDAVLKRKRERVWRQYQNIINVQKLVMLHENPPKVTQYDRLRDLSVEGLATFLDDVQTDALFLEGTIHDLKYPTDWKKWLESEVEVLKPVDVDNPSTANAVPLPLHKGGE